MEIKLLKTEEDYQNALDRLDQIFHAKPGTKEHEELEVIVLLLEKYENEITGADFFSILNRMRKQADSAPSLEEISEEVEAVRKRRYGEYIQGK